MIREKKYYWYLRLIRPKNWIKNILIFIPLVFVGQIFDLAKLKDGVLLFTVFCFLASAVYIINDINDRAEDAVHPKKKERPIAAGKVAIKEAIFITTILLLTTVILILNFPLAVILILLFYFILNIVYSFYLKQLPLFDIFAITIMYLLRIYAGGVLFDISISHWLVLCTFFLALFLITAKRRAEFCHFQNEENHTRKVLFFYNRNFLDHLLTITTTAVLVSYSLYAISVAKSYLFFSIIIAAFGIFRYLYLVYQYNIGESPETVLFHDKILLTTILIWGLYVVFIFL